MTTSFPFTVHYSPFTFNPRLWSSGKCTENGKWLMVNDSEGASDV